MYAFYISTGQKKKTEVKKSDLNPVWNEVIHNTYYSIINFIN